MCRITHSDTPQPRHTPVASCALYRLSQTRKPVNSKTHGHRASDAGLRPHTRSHTVRPLGSNEESGKHDTGLCDPAVHRKNPEACRLPCRQHQASFSSQRVSAGTMWPLPGMPLGRGHSVVLSTVSREGQYRKGLNKFSQDHQEEDGLLLRTDKKILKRK